MPVIYLLCIFAVWGIAGLHSSCTPKKKAYTKEELELMQKQMIGKSKKEKRKILKQFH